MDNEELVNILIKDSVVKAVKVFGIEGTEMKIKELYWFNNKLKNALLKELYKLYYKDKNEFLN